MIVVAAFFFPVFIKADCEICDFTIQEISFNESIVGYYMAGFDLSTGDSNVLLFGCEGDADEELYQKLLAE